MTNDVHYEEKGDALLQSVMSRISKTHAAADDGIGDSDGDRGCYFVKSRDQIKHSSFTDDMYSRTCEIAARCTTPNLDFTEYLFPPYEVEADVDWKAFEDAGLQGAQV